MPLAGLAPKVSEAVLFEGIGNAWGHSPQGIKECWRIFDAQGTGNAWVPKVPKIEPLLSSSDSFAGFEYSKRIKSPFCKVQHRGCFRDHIELYWVAQSFTCCAADVPIFNCMTGTKRRSRSTASQTLYRFLNFTRIILNNKKFVNTHSDSFSRCSRFNLPY